VKTDFSPSAFEVFPPQKHAEWLHLGSLLEENKPPFAPDNFSAMVGQFEGIKCEIRGGKIRGFRPTESGFRFVLQLNQAYTLKGPDILGFQVASPGDYLITYDGGFKIETLTPIDLHIDIETSHKQSFTALVPSSIPLRIVNIGLEDAVDMSFSANITSPDGNTFQHNEVNLSILAGEQERLYLPFAPDSPGDWTLQVSVKTNDISALDPIDGSNQFFQLSVHPAPRSSLEQNITAFGLIQAWQLIALLMTLASSALIFVLALFHQPDHLKTSTKEFAKNEKGK
jgi:hypothetical protein